MDLDNPLRSVCPDPHGRLLEALARADQPLTRNQLAERAELSSRGALRALDDLVDAGLVWRAKVAPLWHWHMLYRQHLATDLIMALVRLDLRLARHVRDHVAEWQCQPHSVALRLPCPDPPTTVTTGPPCPDVADPDRARAAIDVLVVSDQHDTVEDDNAGHLARLMHHWTGNGIHLQRGHHADPAALSAHDTAAAWWLLAGTAPPGLPIEEPDTPSDQQIALSSLPPPATNGPFT